MLADRDFAHPLDPVHARDHAPAAGGWEAVVAVAPPAFFSTISCAIRTRVRRMSSRSSTTFSLLTCLSFLISLDPVKGVALRNVAARPDGPQSADRSPQGFTSRRAL